MLSSTLGDKSPVYFWKETEKTYGFLSQWYIAPFNAPISAIDSSPICFQSAEQYMMYQKAILFGDYKIADQILGAAKPGLQKSLGRKVQGFDEALWEAEKNRIVEEGNWHKFSTEENSGLKRRLLNTGERELVEASALDRIWGIGYSAANAESNRQGWGENLLGKALERVRDRLRAG